jgi:glyoxylase-like metal-dependent hydrolase (beta-lactamase superfamily II)
LTIHPIKLSIRPQEIKLIILTHGHWDHIGSVKEIKDLTGAKVALHGAGREWLEKALQPMPHPSQPTSSARH